MIDLTKRIEPGTWRYLGQRVSGLSLTQIPIAGKSIHHIADQLAGQACAVARVRMRNAFVVECPPLRLIYVRPRYRGYRRVGHFVFPSCPWPVDFDHALAKGLAASLGYGYVLLMRVNPKVNRGHGRFERVGPLPDRVPDLCFIDDRIGDKAIGRGPSFMAKRRPLAFDPLKTKEGGWTLKQAGRWAFALGVDDEWVPNRHLRPATTSEVEVIASR